MDEDEGNIVTTWPHMAETEKGKEGERRWMEVTTPVMEIGEEALGSPERLTPTASTLDGDG